MFYFLKKVLIKLNPINKKLQKYSPRPKSPDLPEHVKSFFCSSARLRPCRFGGELHCV